MTTTGELLNYLSVNQALFRIRTHLPTLTSRAIAVANHVSEESVARILVFKADSQYWMAVYPGDSQLNKEAVCRGLNIERIEKVNEWDLERLFPGCETGAIPPFGNLFGLNVIVDSSFPRIGQMVFNVCSRSSSVTIEWSDFDRLVHPCVAPFAEPASVVLEYVH
jgi:Ala-tRNA(Pro) deacylase